MLLLVAYFFLSLQFIVFFVVQFHSDSLLVIFNQRQLRTESKFRRKRNAERRYKIKKCKKTLCIISNSKFKQDNKTAKLSPIAKLRKRLSEIG